MKSKGKKTIGRRRQERELWFWTVRQTLILLLFASFVIYCVSSMASGRVPVEAQIIQLLRGQ